MRCTVCPRSCPVDRSESFGFCGCSAIPYVARIGLHHDEEPFFSGTRGSGTIFFSGCNLNCIFCQNHAIHDASFGTPYSPEMLADAMLWLQSQGAHNINLVTPTPHRDSLLKAIPLAKTRGLTLPILYNTNAYETVETIHLLDGLIDLYLPDLKYTDPRLSLKFSYAKDYAAVALDAISAMIDSVGFLRLDENGLAVRGVQIRHLVLPACVYDTRSVLDAILARFGRDCPISLMSQYTPTAQTKEPPLHRKLTVREYDNAVEYALSLGFTHLLIQGMDSVGTHFTPTFTASENKLS